MYSVLNWLYGLEGGKVDAMNNKSTRKCWKCRAKLFFKDRFMKKQLALFDELTIFNGCEFCLAWYKYRLFTTVAGHRKL